MAFLVMCHHQHWCQLWKMLMASSMAPSHSLGQDIQNEMQHDLFGHVMFLAPALHDSYGIIIGNIAFHRSRLSK